MQLSVRNTRSLLTVALALALLMPALVSASNECSFSRTLDLGVEGEDVRCLQQFLNDRGFTIAADGPGSPGSETTRFGALTETAVLAWQQDQGIAGANGVFGPASQAAYLLDVMNVLENQVATQTTVATAVWSPTPQVAGASSVSEETIVATFIEALDTIELADDEVEHRILTDEPYSDHLRSLNKAKRDFFSATAAYFTGSKTSAYSLLLDVIEYATDAADESNSSSFRITEDQDDEDDVSQNSNASLSVVEKRRNAWDDIDDMWDEYEDVKDEIEEAEDDDEDVDDAEDYLDEAGDVIEDAEDAANDADFDEVEDLLDEAADLLKDAEDEL